MNDAILILDDSLTVRMDLADAFECVKKTDFWISHGLLDERLRARRSR